jgi:hypothetical protein
MWVQLRRGNDWGRNYLAVEPHNAHGMASADRGLAFSGEVRVLFPDETTMQLPVVNVPMFEVVNDMGHESRVTSEIAHAKVVLHGIDVLVPLDQEGLRVWLADESV